MIADDSNFNARSAEFDSERERADARSVFDPATPIPNAPTPDEYVRGFATGFGADSPFFAAGTGSTLGAGEPKALLYYRRSAAGGASGAGAGTSDLKTPDSGASSAGPGDAQPVDAQPIDAGAWADGVRTVGVGIAGAGLMGISIAAAFLGGGFPVLAFDSFDAALATAPSRVANELTAQRKRRGEAASDDGEEARIVGEIVSRLFRTTGEIGELAARPVVVESIPEKTKIKAKFYRALDAAATAPILLLSNTSSLRVGDLAATLPVEADSRPTSRERFCAFHFFHPVCKRSLVEIARGTETAPETLARAAALAERIAKTPISVADGPGFLVNRLLQPYLSEGLVALEEGIPAERIESVCRRFGTEAGPLRIMDEIGLDVSLRAGWSFFKAFPERTSDSAILPELTREGRLGRKSRRGFYRFASGESWADDATLDFDAATLAALERNADFAARPTGGRTAVGGNVENVGNVDDGASDASANDSSANDGGESISGASVSDETLALRFALAILFEGARLVDDGIVGSFRECDAGLTLALGFPANKGGIFYWAASFGLPRLLAAARRLEPLGARFVAPESLARLCRSGAKGSKPPQRPVASER